MKMKRYLVSPSGYDDIGDVLSGMGEGFEYGNIDWKDLRSARNLSGCEVLFVNCASELNDDEYVKSISSSIRDFVDNGGSLYCSCWAVTCLEASFRGLFSHSGDMYSDTVRAEVLDAGLREYLGKNAIDITLCGWWPTKTSARFDGVCYLRGAINRDEVEGFDTDDQSFLGDLLKRKTSEKFNLAYNEVLPLLVSFKHGKGHVIYTAFHNEEQLSEDEQKLLKYLVLRPIMAHAAEEAAQAVDARRCTPGKEIIDSLCRGKPSKPYQYQAAGGESIVFLLTWRGNARLSFAVRDPTGKTVFHNTAEGSPLIFEASNVMAGPWIGTIEGLQLPHDNFPYVLTLATRGRKVSLQGPVETKPPAEPTKQVERAGRVWPCYILVDCSEIATMLAPVLGQGLSKFVSGLKTSTGGGVTPAVSIAGLREGSETVPTAVMLKDLGQVKISCNGRLVMDRALRELVGRVEWHHANGDYRPLVVMLLFGEPNDSYMQNAAKLLALVDKGWVRILSVGMGSVSDKTLGRLAKLRLRVIEPQGSSLAACLEWISKLAATVSQSLANSTPIELPPIPAGIQKMQ